MITAAAVLDRSEAYQGRVLGLEAGLAVGDRGLVGTGCSVIVVHLNRFETDDGVTPAADERSAAGHVPAVTFGTAIALCYTCV
jgi:hypothetical protein